MTETAVVTRTCKAKVKRDDGKLEACGTTLPKGNPECRNKKAHLHPLKTGFCSDGAHEGVKSALKTCEFWQSCPCECHLQFDQMFLMTQQPRVLMDNPKYMKPKDEFWMPRLGDPAWDEAMGKREEKSIQVAPLEQVHRHFSATPTGKRARGQLEHQVLEVCQQFMKGLLEDVEDLTPNIIAREIDEVEPPSVGAIGAVFDRWVALGFAVCEKKPVRFVSLTVDGMMHGLDNMKSRAKQLGKRKQAADNRGTFRRQ